MIDCSTPGIRTALIATRVNALEFFTSLIGRTIRADFTLRQARAATYAVSFSFLTIRPTIAFDFLSNGSCNRRVTFYGWIAMITLKTIANWLMKDNVANSVDATWRKSKRTRVFALAVDAGFLPVSAVTVCNAFRSVGKKLDHTKYYYNRKKRNAYLQATSASP